MQSYLDFEKGLAELQGKAVELRSMAAQNPELDLEDEAAQLDKRAEELLRDLYESLDPWQKAQVARHPARPHAQAYITRLFTDYTPLAGDRAFAEDHAVVGGLARLDDRPVVVIGHEKGHDTPTRLMRNFGMARPEGYRKATRLMELAHRFGLAVITLVDTPGAYPGKGAEERGQAEAIARATQTCLNLQAPLISVIIGEGGSGGAVAFASASHVIMLEHAIYSVISPEGCASILWKNAEKMREAATALRLTAQDLKKLGITDTVIPEPMGGAHRAPEAAIDAVGEAVRAALKRFDGMAGAEIKAARRSKFLEMGALRLT